jgi:hypothetical protein
VGASRHRLRVPARLPAVPGIDEAEGLNQRTHQNLKKYLVHLEPTVPVSLPPGGLGCSRSAPTRFNPSQSREVAPGEAICAQT